MKTNEVNMAIEEACADYIDVCPHCGAKAHLVQLHDEYHITRNGDQYNYILFRCKPCEKLSLKVYRSTQNPYSDDQLLTMDDWIAKFPNVDMVPDEKFIVYVPAEVVADYTEGLVCLSAGANRAAVSMFRRAMQDAMLEQGADQKLDLIDQIKSVANLTKDIKDWAHNVRIFGNWGAHPQDDLLKDVTHELAQEVRELLEEFMNYVYVMPGKISAARDRYNKKNDDDKSESDGKDEAA